MWGDCDLRVGKTVWIKRSWGMRYQDDGSPTFRPTKGKARRKIKLPPKLFSALNAWKLKCPTNQWDLVFPNPTGTGPISNRNRAGRSLELAVQEANSKVPESEKMPVREIHSLRHSFASCHLNQGDDVVQV